MAYCSGEHQKQDWMKNREQEGMITTQFQSNVLSQNGYTAAHFEQCLLESLFRDQFYRIVESSTWPARYNLSQRASLLEEVWNICFKYAVHQLPLKTFEQLGDYHSINICTQIGSSTSPPIERPIPEDQDSLEIIFTTLLAGDKTSKVECRRDRDTLQNVQDKGYLVLSYVRGDEDGVKDIEVDGKSLKVPKTLELLLKQLRHYKEEILLWFDEICFEEPGSSFSGGLVDQMKAIYSKAKGVVVWLGDESDTSEMAYLFLETLGNCSTQEHQERLIYNCFTSAEAPPALNYLFEVLTRPWWDRASLLQPLLENCNLQVRFGNRTLSWEIFQNFFDILQKKEIRSIVNTTKQSPQVSDFLCQIPHRVGHPFEDASRCGNNDIPRVIDALCSNISRIASRDPSERSMKWTLAFLKVATNIGPMLDELALRISGSYTQLRRFDFFAETNDEAMREELTSSLKGLGPPSWFTLGPLPQSVGLRYGSRLSVDRYTELVNELKEFPLARILQGAEAKILELAARGGINVPEDESTMFASAVIAKLINESGGVVPSYLLGEEGDRAKGWILRFLEGKAVALKEIRQILKESDMAKHDETGQTIPTLADFFPKQEKQSDDDFRCWWSVLNAVSKTRGDPDILADQLQATSDLDKQSIGEDVDINAEAPFTYEPLPPNEKAIRMLIVLPSSDNESQVQCKLVKFDLEVMMALGITRYPFAALSYVWGNKIPPQTVLLHGKEVTITPNLGAALRNFRDTRLPVMLWVDALCINQADDNEKSHQISLMGLIYHRAGHVLMWLGQETVGTGHAVLPLYLYDFLRTLQKYANPNVLKELEKSLEKTHTLEHLCSIHTMLQWKYWTRVWIVQEVLLAQEATVCWGPYTVSWQSVLNACGCNGFVGGITHPHYMTREKPLAGRLGLIYARRTPELSMKLSDALLLGRNRSSSNPRDYVYAFLGLCDGADVIHADYTKPLKLVFQDTFEAIVSREKTLDVLSYCQRYMKAEEFDERSTTWPSWLPYWSHKQAGKDIETKHSILGGRGLRIYRASKELEAEICLSKDKQLLTAKGVFFDKVEVVSQQPWPTSLEVDWASYQKSFGARSPYGTTHSQQLALTHTAYLGQGTIDEAPLIAFKSDDALIATVEKSLEIKFGKTIEDTEDTRNLGDLDHKPTNNNVADVPATEDVMDKAAGIFARALQTFLKKAPCNGESNLLFISLPPKSYMLGKADLVDGSSLTSFSRRMDQALDISLKTLQAASEDNSNARILELSRDSHELSRRLHERPLHESRFFVTTKGYFGRGPIPVGEGDWVCVLLGAKVPFVLRYDENTGSYSLIGESCKC
jgi:hypothetical protein